MNYLPADISVCINDWISSVARNMPFSSSGPYISSVLRSNQDGISNPAFSVTACVGAVGQITFMYDGRIWAIACAQPCLFQRDWNSD